MGRLRCILCSPWSCCGSGKRVIKTKTQEHHRTQLSGLDQAIRSINFGQNEYARQVDEPNHENTLSSRNKMDHSLQGSLYKSASLEPYRSPEN